MSSNVTVRTRKFLSNRLLGRKQMVVDVFHSGAPTVPKSDIRKRLAESFKTRDANTIVLFGFRTAFGGGRSTGFCFIYDDLASLRRVEPRFRQVRQGLAEAPHKIVRKDRKTERIKRTKRFGTAARAERRRQMKLRKQEEND